MALQSIKTKKLFYESKILENQEIFYEDGRIKKVELFEGEADVDCLSAAFFDIHINGGEEHYLTQSNSAEAIQDIFESSVKTGTYFVLPTLITSSKENILKGIAVMKQFLEENPSSGVLGLHLEGPFLNPLKRGAHLEKYVRVPSDDELNEIISAGEGIIKLMTIAPEYFSKEQIRKIQSKGITVSFGHSNASFEEAQKGFESGVNLVTHLYNAMSGLHHRKPGLVGAALAHSHVWCPVIPDGKHIHYGALKAAYQAKGEHLFIISDALFLGRKKMSFQWEEFDAELKNGEYLNSEGNLAGSAISMGEAVKNMVHEVGVTLEEAIDMATVRPAKALGMIDQLSKVEVGYPAVFTVFDESLERFESLNMLL
ncbi:N-acetylglucosamine-6-phosphate deacetylase [Jiulongibacter sp. NS-SX5]|uniref:N-acetylglucosamine-6-phosphate deacetylase n=1 Tax=Jiulongibacter sp. NS-SX5 TaxID=3463854 RepID=UPI004059D2A0